MQRQLIALAALAILLVGASEIPTPPALSAAEQIVATRFATPWVTHPYNPMLSSTKTPTGWGSVSCSPGPPNFNDPDIMVAPDAPDGAALAVYVSVGLCDSSAVAGGEGVRTYLLTSSDANLNDGISLAVANGNEPVLARGAPEDFDHYGVETPDVARLGSTWHAYYTFYSSAPNLTHYKLAHASSADGKAFTGRSVLAASDVVGTPASACQSGNQPGCIAIAEPSVIAHPTDANPLWVYAEFVRCRVVGSPGCHPTVVPPAVREIRLLRCASDGVTCQDSIPVNLSPPDLFPARLLFDGPSTPHVYRDAGGFILTVSYRRQMPDGNWPHAIVEYRSPAADGVNFTFDNVVAYRGMQAWTANELRSLSIQFYQGQLLGLFCGNNWGQSGVLGTDFTAGCGMIRRFRF